MDNIQDVLSYEWYGWWQSEIIVLKIDTRIHERTGMYLYHSIGKSQIQIGSQYW